MVHTDYLGTPRYIIDSSNNVLWNWDNTDPFGTTLAQGSIEFNLRFAGQYYDSESSLHYNMFRTYDPASKRYMQSDPIGLGADFNTYNYVGRNPLNMVDYLGLDVNIFLGSAGLKLFGRTVSPGHLGLGVTGFDEKIWHNLPGVGVIKGDFLSSENYEGRKIEGFMNTGLNDSMQYIRIKTTEEQDKKLIEYLNKSWKTKKDYNFPYNDCVTFVKNALDYAGVKYNNYFNLLSIPYSKIPMNVYQDILNENEVLEQGVINYPSLGTSDFEKQILKHILRAIL